jgi:hypothetical protein
VKGSRHSKYRHLALVIALIVVVAVLASASVAGQAPRAAGNTTNASTFNPPRTPWGDPDLEGLWRGIQRINFERPPDEKREFLADAEVLELERKADARNELRLQGKQENRGNRNQPNYNAIVGYSPEKASYAKRTSAIVDPPEGLLPGWTLEQVKYYEHREAMTVGRGDADWAIDRPTSERCIPVIAPPVLGFWGMALKGTSGGVAETAGTVNVGEGYSNSTDGGGPYRIVQNPGFVVILEEEQGLGGGNAGSRVIPTDGRPVPPASKFRHWMGISRGRWEGNTLVVVTTNLTYPGPIITSYGPNYPGTGHTLTYTERWTRTGPNTMDYRYTVDDPAVYVRPYTVQHELNLYNDYKISNVLCHEGHDDMPSALAAGRFDEITSVDNANDTRLQREPRLKQLKEEAMKAAGARGR